ncbi:hypothetical protein [Devosia sp. 2618]|uniref:hypothetical protein n=1 Tax=Devosia sp. 2618 TaxID=3156454 RepID=UPI0033967F6C
MAVTTCNAGDRLRIHLDDSSPALHMPVGNRLDEVEPAFEDYAYMLFDVCNAMGLTSDECMIYPLNGALGGNAIATIEDGNRVIVYDRELSPLIGSDGAEMVVAHEVAHHFCGHLGTPTDATQELEVDLFAGAAMRLMGRSLNGALSAVDLFSERPSKSHPARGDRIDAITAGWNRPEVGKVCG